MGVTSTSVRTPAPAHPWWAGLPLLWLGATVFWWGLAFPPVPGDPPRWVATVQTICFGAGVDGLPAPYGWGALIAPPLVMLVVMLTGWGREVTAALRQLVRHPLGQGLVTLLSALLVLQTGWVVWSMAGQLASPIGAPESVTMEELPENYPRLNHPAPPFSLTDQRGNKYSLGHLRGKVAYLTFAYGHCTTVCPLVVNNIARAIAENPATTAPEMVIITMDAWRDTPSTLEGILRRWKLPASAAMLTGPPGELMEVLDRFQVKFSRDEKTGRIDHLALVYVLDPAGRIAFAFNNPSIPWLIEAARRAKEPAS